MILMRGVQCGTLYKLLERTVIDGCNNSNIPENKDEEIKVRNISREDTMLWHQILGHIGEKCLQSLQGKGMIKGLSNCNSDFDFCEHCLYGKHNRMKFPSGARRENEILELIHNDVFGHVPVPLLGGSMYYVIFIYDFPVDTSLYFLKKKEVFNILKEYNALVENQTRNKIKALRNDNGGVWYSMVENNSIYTPT